MKFNNHMLYLALCGVKGAKVDEGKVKDLDLDYLFKECEFHKLTALICYVLEDVVKLDKKWIDEKGKSVRKNLLLDLERNKIISFMEKSGIKYMPLKGVIIKDYYPKPGMRQMADNDIFFDGNYRKDVEDFMKSIGYSDVYYGRNDDEYKRDPVYNFEMHYKLFSENDGEVFASYYSNIENKLIKDENNSYGYHFKKEDFYIYFIAHQYKHYTHGGIGIRSLIDCGILLGKFGDEYDWQYIKEECNKLEIAEFEEKQRKLWYKLEKNSEAEDLTEEEIAILQYLTMGGAYGTVDIGATNSIKAKIFDKNETVFLNKIKYVFSRLFPPIEFYKDNYPFFYKHKILIPVCFFYRIGKAIFQKNNIAKTEVKLLMGKK